MLTNQYAFDALLPAVEMYQAFIDDSHDKLRAEFELACCSGTTQDCTGCIHSMQPCIQTFHPTAGSHHFTCHHCHARAFLFHSQKAKDIPSVVNGIRTR